MAKRKTRSVTVYSARRNYRRRRGFFQRGKIPIAPIMGMIPGITFASEPVRLGRSWEEAFARFVVSYTGYNFQTKAFETYYLSKGLAPLLGGMLLHGIANWVGINKAIARFRLPVEI